MEQQGNKAWVVNASEAINRTCDTIYREYKEIVEAFNQRIIDACSKKKRNVVYRTDNKQTFDDLLYFYTCLGYKIEPDEETKYEDEVKCIYKIKLMW